MKLLANRILVRLDKSEEPKETSQEPAIYIPDSENRSKFKKGTVILTGNGNMPNGDVISLTVQTGNEVMLPRLAGTEIRLDGKDLLLTTEAEVAVIL